MLIAQNNSKSITVPGWHVLPNAIKPVQDTVVNRIKACIPILGIVINHKTEAFIGTHIRCVQDTDTAIQLIKQKNTYKALAILRMVIATISLMQIGGRGWGIILGIGLLLGCLPSLYIHGRNIMLNKLSIVLLETKPLPLQVTIF